jgi:hypothetical protein
MRIDYVYPPSNLAAPPDHVIYFGQHTPVAEVAMMLLRTGAEYEDVYHWFAPHFANGYCTITQH